MDGHKKEKVTRGGRGWREYLFAFPLGVASILIGIASLGGNIVWNCETCGWDLDGVPWYQALLVAGVPLLVAPAGVLLFGSVLLTVRTKRVAVEFLLVTLGLALPWLYWLRPR